MKVDFKNVVLLESYSGTSQKGRAFGKVRFATDDYDIYEVFCSADFANSLKQYEPKHVFPVLSFDLQPEREGGVRLVPLPVDSAGIDY